MAGPEGYRALWDKRTERMTAQIDALTSDLERVTDSMTIVAGQIGRISGIPMFVSGVISPSISRWEWFSAQIGEKAAFVGAIAASVSILNNDEPWWKPLIFAVFFAINSSCFIINRRRRQKLDYKKIFDGEPWDIDWYQKDPGLLTAPSYSHIHRVFHILRGGPKIPEPGFTKPERIIRNGWVWENEGLRRRWPRQFDVWVRAFGRVRRLGRRR